MSEYEFTVDWFEQYRGTWDAVLNMFPPRKVLEIGSFEGRSACYLIERLSNVENSELYCVDTWEGGEDHAGYDMGPVEGRFLRNTAIASAKSDNKCKPIILKGLSSDILIKLISEGHSGTFDMIYIDGSHQAPDVLEDLVLSYKLCKAPGIIICDDYLWRCPTIPNIVHEPKIAIDSFVNIYRERVGLIMRAPLVQVYIQKLK